MPNAQLKLALKKIEQGKADSAELILKKAEIKDLSSLNDSYTLTIRDLTTEKQVQNLLLETYKVQVGGLQSDLKKQKRKKIAGIIAAIVGTSGLFYLLK